MAQVSFAEDDEVIQALSPDGRHEALRVWVAVRALRRNRDALHAVGFEPCRPRLGEHRIPIVDQAARLAQKPIHGVQQVPSHLLHPIPVRSDVDPCDLHRARLHLHDEEHHVADGAEHAEDLDTEEVARV
jgi:hypothetical protein